jgi:hypothetical protein
MAVSGSSFAELMAEMMAMPVDPTDPGPLSNRPATMYGTTIPFHILSWVAVFARLYTRFRVIRDPGWDDLVVVLAALFNLGSLVGFLGCIEYGMGKHLALLPVATVSTTMKWLYVQQACYNTTTALIKISLLLQYLRLFSSRTILHRICLVLLITVSLWGFAYGFMSWFPCFPVSGFWNRYQTPEPVCYGFGMKDGESAFGTFVSAAATNMALDTMIFLVPMCEYLKPGLGKRAGVALTGLFMLGSVVVLMSILRLWSVTKHSDGNTPSNLDFTWWYPFTLILSCLEVDFAIMCASMPIFWPVVFASLSQIFVTKEVRVTHHQRLTGSSEQGMCIGAEYELGDGRTTSLKSHTSRDGLTGNEKLGAVVMTNYNDEMVRDHVTGKRTMEVGIEGKWRNLKD